MSVFIKKTKYGFEVWTSYGPREIFETISQARKYAKELSEIKPFIYKLPNE